MALKFLKISLDDEALIGGQTSNEWFKCLIEKKHQSLARFQTFYIFNSDVYHKNRYNKKKWNTLKVNKRKEFTEPHIIAKVISCIRLVYTTLLSLINNFRILLWNLFFIFHFIKLYIPNY